MTKQDAFTKAMSENPITNFSSVQVRIVERAMDIFKEDENEIQMMEDFEKFKKEYPDVLNKMQEALDKLNQSIVDETVRTVRKMAEDYEQSKLSTAVNTLATKLKTDDDLRFVYVANISACIQDEWYRMVNTDKGIDLRTFSIHDFANKSAERFIRHFTSTVK